MCGIAGYIGKKDGLRAVTDSLRLLEYRGYDSAGVFFFGQTGPILRKCRGKLENLIKKTKGWEAKPFFAAIGHTRWATHGLPNKTNAHPHFDCRKEIFLTHNGIIENYQELKKKLIKSGHQFSSQTDTEVIAHLIEEELKLLKTKLGFHAETGFEKAVQSSLKKLIGAYALAIVDKNQPQKIHFAKLGSPLILGLGKNEYLLASDPTPLAGTFKKVIYLKDGQQGWISPQEFKIWPSQPKIENLNLNPEQAQKGNFPHFMLKEIFEEPEAVATAFRGRLFPQKNTVKLGGLEKVAKKLNEIKKIEIIACGTSYHAGLVGELLFEEIAEIPAKTTESSEYRYRHTAILPKTASLFISQSGETADTLAALRQATANKSLTLGLVNAVGSAMARETKAGVYNHAGPEIAVASTKSFVSQLSILNLMTVYFAKNRERTGALAAALAAIPEQMKKILKQNEQIKKLAKKYLSFNNFMFLGRKYNYPVALEGALKLKEIGYAHAEGKAAGELKHGPLALIEPNFPTIALVNQNSVYEKMLSNLQEIKTRQGRIIAIATVGDKKIGQIADEVVYVPKTLEPLEPLLNVIPLQLFAYHFGVLKGYEVDKPRNLAKSVTVE